MNRHRYVIVTPVRWEADSIVEWLVYHRSIGFAHVYLYCNDDDASELHDRVCPFLIGPDPFVTFTHYPFQGLQWDIYLHWFRHYAREVEWAAFLDADEFLTLPGVDDIGRFMARQPEGCDAIHFHWIYYGTNGFLTRPPGSVLRQYTRRAQSVSFETKTMVRPDRIRPDALRPQQLPFWHLWDEQHAPGLRSFTALGDPMTQGFNRRIYAFDRDAEIKKAAFVAHFALRSEADFLRRQARGTGGQFYGQAMWARRMETGQVKDYLAHTNAEEDLYLTHYWHRLVKDVASTSLMPPRPGLNLAEGRPCRQSSTGPWSIHPDAERDAAGAVSGRVSGRPSFHTGEEFAPWWQVDLEALRLVQQIRIFNRVDDIGVANRVRPLVMQISADGMNWAELHRSSDTTTFGGADGRPLIWTADTPVPLRYLRLMVEAHLAFGLDQVEVFGPIAPTVTILSTCDEASLHDLGTAQRAILAKLASAGPYDGFRIEQIASDGSGGALTAFLEKATADVVVLLDVGCLPLHSGALGDLVAYALQGELAGCLAGEDDEGAAPGTFCLAFSKPLWEALGGSAVMEAAGPDAGAALSRLWAASTRPTRLIWPDPSTGEYGRAFAYARDLGEPAGRAAFLDRCRRLSASMPEERRIDWSLPGGCV